MKVYLLKEPKSTINGIKQCYLYVEEREYSQFKKHYKDCEVLKQGIFKDFKEAVGVYDTYLKQL